MDLCDFLPSEMPKVLSREHPRKADPPALTILARKKVCKGCTDHYGTGCWKDHEYGCENSRNAAFALFVRTASCPIGRWDVVEQFQGRGIVTLAGGLLYTLNAYILCRLLRYYGCTLPIEWFYLGDEMRRDWEDFISQTVPDIELINLGGRGNKAKWRGGFQNKTRAVLESSFDELFFLDADSHPLRDPTYMFDEPLYREHGALLWPDCWGDNNPDTMARWTEAFGVAPYQQTESGQMLFCKSRCLDGLRAAHALNSDPATYRTLYGDKDTFAIGMMQTKTPFHWVPGGKSANPAFGGMMHPRDCQGNKLLSHLVRAKWNCTMIPRMHPRNYPMLDKAMQFGREIVGLLDPNYKQWNDNLSRQDRLRHERRTLLGIA